MVYMCLLFILSVLPLRGNIMLLNSQLSAFSEPETVLIPKELFRDPVIRSLINPKASCFMNTTTQLLARLYGDLEFRKAIIEPVVNDSTDTFETLRYYIVNMLNEYYSPSISNHTFLTDYLKFLADVDATGLFKVCVGERTIDTLVNFLDVLFKVKINVNMVTPPQSPIQLIEVPLPKISRYNKRHIVLSGPLFQYLQSFSSGKNYQWPRFLLISLPIESVKELFDPKTQKPYSGILYPIALELKSNRYSLIGMVLHKPNHAFAIVRYGKKWYCCNDDTIFELGDARYNELLVNGVFTHTGNTNFLDYALPAVFLYERL